MCFMGRGGGSNDKRGIGKGSDSTKKKRTDRSLKSLGSSLKDGEKRGSRLRVTHRGPMGIAGGGKGITHLIGNLKKSELGFIAEKGKNQPIFRHKNESKTNECWDPKKASPKRSKQ